MRMDANVKTNKKLISVSLFGASVKKHQPNFLLLHGMADNSSSWNQVAESFKDQFNVWLIDMPWSFNGGMSWLGQKSPETCWKEALSMIEGEPDVILAHSFASLVVLDWLANTNMNVKKIILVSPFFPKDKSCLNWENFDAYARNIPMLLRNEIKVRLGQKNVSDAIVEGMINIITRKMIPWGLIEFYRLYIKVFTYYLKNIVCKVTIIVGEKDKNLKGSCSKVLNEKLKNSERVELSSCGHFCMLEAPDLFKREIESAINKVF